MTDDEVAARALDTIRQAIEEAAVIIDNIQDPSEAFKQADQLADGIRELHKEQVMDLQRRQVERIWTSEEMSLAELARRTSRSSRQRAHQLLQDALSRKEQS